MPQNSIDFAAGSILNSLCLVALGIYRIPTCREDFGRLIHKGRSSAVNREVRIGGA
jgi:hypothetical protein